MTRRLLSPQGSSAAEAAGDAGMNWDGTDLAIVGNLKIGDNKVVKFDDAEAVTIGYESATGDVEFNGADLDLNNQGLVNAGSSLAIGTSGTTFTSAFAADGDTSGTLVYFLNTTVVKGDVYFLNVTGPAWSSAQANAAATASGLLAVAKNTNSNTHGMMLQGFVRLDSGSYEGTPAIGAPLYLSDTTAKQLTFTVPATSGDVVRVCGHCLQKDGSNHILVHWNPSSDYIELA